MVGLVQLALSKDKHVMKSKLSTPAKSYGQDGQAGRRDTCCSFNLSPHNSMVPCLATRRKVALNIHCFDL